MDLRPLKPTGPSLHHLKAQALIQQSALGKAGLVQRLSHASHCVHLLTGAVERKIH